MRIFSTEQSVGIKVGSLPTILKKNYADKKDIIIKKKDYDVSFLFNRNILKELDILFSLNNKDEFMEKLTLISEDL